MSYVQIGSSRVLLDTWDDIVAAAREGLIDERSYCELKKGLPPSSQNREVACDLASLTVDGGVLIYGVTDAGDGKADDVLGISEPESAKARLIGLAQGKVAPAMACDVRVVSDPDDPARGCVIVEVPPSPIAPHSADDRYWGRSAEGKRVLPEPLVADLFARRRHRDDGLLAHLRGLTGTFDPVPADQRGHGHLYYSALPLTPPQSPPPWDHNKLPLQVVVGAQFPAHGFGGGDLTSLNYTETHPAGIMASSVDRSDPRPDEAYAKRLLIRDTGGIDFVSGRGTMAREARGGGAPVRFVPLAVVLMQVDQCVRLTAHVAQLRGDNGTWHLGVHMNSLHGTAPFSTSERMALGRAPTYSEDEFTQTVHATAREMAETPQMVVERLMGPLARGFGASHAFPYDSPAEFFKRL